ncbi:hypothetical protein UG55_10668 [Frankia sp. EI5c]|uniref:hypothetical protein n=1 Tax=Frankia sp. EI5c TaxID=683316 RepID=UPI0007C376D6|nr:hypothetical protein [Frankia sp. EI5c]OAA20972.1 hypothetical protein UG55_10668 [Frankia sp. EI5c]
MNEAVPGIRRLCIAVAADGGAPDGGDAAPVSASSPPTTATPSLGSLLDEACVAADAGRVHWLAGPGGDELAVFPPGIDEGRVVGDFVRALRLSVSRMNDGAGRRTRLRVALHQGITRCDEQGYGGRAVLKALHLCEAEVLGQELATHPDSDLAFIVSAELFDDVAGDDRPQLRRGEFRQVIVPAPVPGPGFPAWVSAAAPAALPHSAGPSGRRAC